MKQFASLALGVSLLVTASLSLYADPQEVAFAGASFGRSEVKSILENVVGRIPDSVSYVDFGESIAAEEFKNFGLVVIATGSAHTYSEAEAAEIERYVNGGGRLLLIHQAYRQIREAAGDTARTPYPHFEAWLGEGRSYYLKDGVNCTVNLPDDPLLSGVFQQNPSPHWLHASVLLKNADFENLVGHEEYVLVGRKKVGAGTVYYLGSELFRMKLPQYKERHADAVSWARLIENILTDTATQQP